MQKGAAGVMGPTMYEQAPTPMYMGGPGAPPPLSLGLPSSYQPSMIIPQPAAVTVPYDYTASINNPISYNPRPSTYAPPGALIGARPSTYPPPGTVLTAGYFNLFCCQFKLVYVLLEGMHLADWKINEWCYHELVGLAFIRHPQLISQPEVFVDM